METCCHAGGIACNVTTLCKTLKFFSQTNFLFRWVVILNDDVEDHAMLRSKMVFIALMLMPACAPSVSRTESRAENVPNIVHYISGPRMRSGVTPAGATRVPVNANAGQKLYLNPINDAMMLCALVDEVTDTCLRFYRN